jgi:pSer/pThr/pTyr-binding forkhead associated (FHA) protein
MLNIKLKIQQIEKGVSKQEKEYSLKSTEMTIGRSPETDITITDKFASRFHAKIILKSSDEEEKTKDAFCKPKVNKEPQEKENVINSDNAVVFIQDCNSTHGTYVGKQRMEKGKKQEIFSGVMLSFGKQSSFYFLKFYDQNDKEIKNQNLETETNLEIEQEQNIQKINKKSEKKYLDDYKQSQKDRSRLDIYKELLNKEKGFKFFIEGNKTLDQIKSKSKTYRSQFDNKNENKKEKDWEISWGMVDERAINKKGFQDLVLDPALLRKIPGLKTKEQNKINEFDVKLKKYKRLMKEYNDFVGKLNKMKNKGPSQTVGLGR